MTIVDHNHNEDIFANSQSFLPEFWLENKTRSGADFRRYYFSFGKVPRSYLGISEHCSVVPTGRTTQALEVRPDLVGLPGFSAFGIR
jgi:hypothetical protein